MTAAEVAAALSLHMRGVPIVSTRHFAAAAEPGGSPAPSCGDGPPDRAQIAVSEHVADHTDGPSTVVHSGVPARPDSRAGREPRPGRADGTAAGAREGRRRRDRRVRVSGLSGRDGRLWMAGDGALRDR